MTRHSGENARVVVCAVDGSSLDTNALDVAVRLALALRARLALLAVVPSPALDTLDSRLPRWTADEARAVLELTAETLDHPFGVDCYLDSGNRVQRLVEFAARKRALLLVVGTRGRLSRGPTSIVVGGIARSATCPVVVVPDAIAVSELGWPGTES